MPTRLHRYDISGHTHFLTFSTYRRLTFFWHDDIKPHLLARPIRLFSSADNKEADCVVTGREANVLTLRFMSAFRAPSRKYP